MPKQFIKVPGRPVLTWTLETFQRSPEIDAVQIVCQPEEEERVLEIARDYRIDKLHWVTAGGDTCPASIRNGAHALRSSLGDGDIFVLHMGVSPLVSLEDIASSIARCREKGCCFTMHPIRICMARRGGKGWASRDAPKEKYIELNTPWAFRYGDLYDLYRRLEERGHVFSETDYTLALWLADGCRATPSAGTTGRRRPRTPLTAAELDALIRRTTPEKARANCRAILEYYGAHETGNATETAAGYICSILNKTN